MNLFRVNRLPLFDAPDVQPGATPPAVDPAVVAAVDPNNPPPAPTPDPAPTPAAAADPAIPGDPAAAPEGEPKPPHGNTGKKPWYMGRISEESERARRAEAQLAEAQALLDRFNKTPPADPKAPRAPMSADADIETRARQLADEQLQNREIQRVIQKGVGHFTDWDSRAETLAAVGAATPAFVLDVVSVDPENAHLILHQLADNPDRASQLARMDGRTRTVELVKMSMALNPPSNGAPAKPAAPAKTVSKAPPPPPQIEPGASPSIDWRSDKASDADFSKGWEENQAKRANRLRR